MSIKNNPEKDGAIDKLQASSDAYYELLDAIKDLSGKTDRAEFTESLHAVVKEVISILSSSDVTTALMISTSKEVDKEDYMFAHILNVCLVSVMIGMKKGLDERSLKDLALLSFVHAKTHIGIPEELVQWVGDNKEMDEIVKLADVYDSMTHPPSYRLGMTSFETLTSILDACDLFEPPLVKELLGELGFYPEGSWVELNTREVGKVIKENKEMALRPVVEIVIGEKKKMDLSRHMLIYIVRALTEEQVEKIKKEGRFE